jgi:hypothetical protein
VRVGGPLARTSPGSRRVSTAWADAGLGAHALPRTGACRAQMGGWHGGLGCRAKGGGCEVHRTRAVRGAGSQVGCHQRRRAPANPMPAAALSALRAEQGCIVYGVYLRLGSASCGRGWVLRPLAGRLTPQRRLGGASGDRRLRARCAAMGGTDRGAVLALDASRRGPRESRRASKGVRCGVCCTAVLPGKLCAFGAGSRGGRRVPPATRTRHAEERFTPG